MALQEEICKFLSDNRCQSAVNPQTAEIMLKGKSINNWLIGEEVKNHHESADNKNRYFKIYYKELRTDVMFVQLSPISCFRSGLLKITSDGVISLLDDKFRTYQASRKFYFKNGKLKSEGILELEGKERYSSRCVKSLFMVGVFAAMAYTGYKRQQYINQDNVVQNNHTL